MSSADRRIPSTVWWLLLAWAAVTTAAVIWALPHEEDDLSDRAQTALADTAVAVEFEGRDAVLTGQVSDSVDLDRAVAVVRQLRGVRRVDSSDVGVDPPPTVPPVEVNPPTLVLELSDGMVTVDGTVATQETADAISLAARAGWGDDAVLDRLNVAAETAGAAWLDGVITAISGLDQLITGTLSAGPAGVLVEGMVATDDAAATIDERLSSAFGDEVSLETRLEVIPLTDPSFEAELLEDGSVRLRGVMPDQATIDRIVAGATGVFGSESVIDEMTVGSAMATPSYLETLPATFGAVSGLRPWRINVEAGQATISGLGISETAIAESLEALSTAYGFRGLELTSELEVDPGAVASVLTELLQGTATFEIGSAQLSAEATQLLDQAIDILQANPATVLTVEGHTDDVGGEEDNLALSEARAQAVVDYLVGGGVDAARLSAVGYGESRPVADNSTADGRAENRRIQFVVEEGDS